MIGKFTHNLKQCILLYKSSVPKAKQTSTEIVKKTICQFKKFC